MPGLASLSILNVATGIALLGVVIEVGTGKLKSLMTPQLPLVALFFGWCIFATIVKVGFGEVSGLKIYYSAIFMLVVMYSVGSFKGFRAMALLLLGIAIFLACVGVKQAMSPLECILLEKDENGQVSPDMSVGEPIGIDCESHRECVLKTKDYENDYLCEKPGPFKTFSISSGRVRWRGTMADPNELSLAIGVALPFVFALHASMKRFWRHLLFVAALGIVSYCVIETESRGGVLVVLAVIGTYFVRRYGAKGLVVGLIFAAPLLLLGGRSGEEAESSALERLGALYEGIDFFRSSPLFGLGCGQFVENYFITAHNSYLLAAAELGYPGLLIWSALVYVSVKIPFTVATTPYGLDPRFRPYAFALMTAFAGMLVGIFFLSFTYHAILFIYFGMSGGLYLAAKKELPTFTVKISPMEIGGLAGFDATLLFVLYVYTRIKGAP